MRKLYERPEEKKETKEEGPDHYTFQMRDAFSQVSCEEEFADFFREHADGLGRLHETAYLKFSELLDRLLRPESSCEVEEQRYTMERVMETYMRMHVPETKRTADYTLLQRMIKKYWPRESSLLNMKNRREDVSRKVMILLLGGTEYRLEAVEGSGSSAVVYRASYKDHLNQTCRHDVLVKELFPYCPKGEIDRDQDGNIFCRESSEVLMEHFRKSFYLGNEVNLQLLKLAPERISGNINSYEAYGTFYSVLAVHGGRNLERILEDGEEPGTLRETAVVILKILDTVECFHRNRILHLDISPDNILLLPERAMLIDYNSVWSMDDGAYRPSEKEGYSAPEIGLGDYADIGPATDLFSVCAVWFRMLTGNKFQSFHAEDAKWLDSRDEVEMQMNAWLDRYEAVNSALTEAIGDSWENLKQMEEELQRRME